MDTYTRIEFAAKLKVQTKTLKRLVAAGVIPEPLMTSPGTMVWTQADLDNYFYTMTNRHRFRKKGAAGPEKPKPPPRPHRDATGPSGDK